MNILEALYRIPGQDKNRWVLLFPNFPHITPYVTQCNIPTYTFDRDDQTKAITGFNFLEDITITFVEDALGTIQLFLGTLEALTWNKESKVFRDLQILARQDAVLIMDDLDVGIMTLGWRFSGLRYLGADTLSLDYSGSGTLEISAHFSVEQVYNMYRLNNFGALPIP
jgi:hypothetical protein